MATQPTKGEPDVQAWHVMRLLLRRARGLGRFAQARAPALPWLAVALAWLCGLWLVLRTPVIWRDQEFLFTVNRAYHLAWKPDMLADGYYPVGYPLLLRILGQALGGNYMLAGKAINLAAYAVALVAVVLVGKRVGVTPAGQAIAAAAIAAAPAVMTVLVRPRTDLPAAALLVLCVAVLIPGGRRSEFWAGCLAGLAYEFRYAALSLTAACGIYLLLSKRWRAAGCFTLGFLAFASPQMALSWYVHGNPLYCAPLARTVAFGLWGEGNVLKNLHRFTGTPISAVLAVWPLFLKHWAGTFLGSFSLLGSGALWAAAAIAGMLLARKHAAAKLALVLAVWWAAISSVIPLQAQYLLVTMFLLAPGIGALMVAVGRGRLAPPRLGRCAGCGRRALQAACAIVIISSYLWAPNDLSAYPAEAAETEYVRIALNRLPGASRDTVVCLGRTYYLSPELPLPLPQLFVELTQQGDFTWADVERLLQRGHTRYLVSQADDAAAFMPAPMARQMIGSTRISLDGMSLVRIGHYGKASIWRVEQP